MFLNTMYTLQEIKHELSEIQEYIVLRGSTNHGIQDLHQEQGLLTFTWVEFDFEGNETGTTTRLSSDEPIVLGDIRFTDNNTKEVLTISFNGFEEDDILFICPVDEYHIALEKALKLRDKALEKLNEFNS